MKSGLNCYNIAAGKPFVNVLARWILELYGRDTAAFPRALILLPTRRACRALREAFLDVAGGHPMLLPRIQPLGDIDEDMALLYAIDDASLPPPVSPVRRELLLTRLVQEFESRRRGRMPGRDYKVGQDTELARQLARFIDDVAREGLDFSALAALAPEDLAVHWQQSLDFLAIVSHHWPDILQKEEAIDSAEHRNHLLRATAEHWRVYPPAHPVIAAGSTGSIPATAELLRRVAQLPKGMVVLPGLDTGMPENEWDMVGETHPQYGLKQLLKGMECKRNQVKDLSDKTSRSGEGNERITVLRAVFQPPEATSRWMRARLPLAEGLRNIQLLTADTLLDEARMVAVALREALETPGKTAALVTPDRALARMVAAQMQRFGVAIDDSAGRKLADTPPGVFLRLAAEMAASQAAPAPLLALLRHPLAGCGMETAECRRLSRMLEIRLLRGVRRTPGIDALGAAAHGYPGLQPLLIGLAKHARPFTGYFEQHSVSLSELLAAHMAFAEWLASTVDEPGSARLWAGEAGNALAAFLAELMQHAGLLDEVDPASYPGLLETLLAEQIHRPRFGLHPRLHILSPMEARLQRFDRVILGSLNEGTWPQQPPADPWMSRPMRTAFGLPAAERAVGQSAHDIFLLCAAPEVILSRARKVEGTPTVPSRWLVRLHTLVAGLDAATLDAMRMDAHYAQGLRLLDAPLPMQSLARPAPLPPLEARPRQMRVTAIDNWLRDPYMIYAQYILKLKKLEPLDEDPDAADFGTLVHKALERFAHACAEKLPDNALHILLECGREAFAEWLDRPGIACLWWPRFEAMAAWLIGIERARHTHITRVFGETKGEWHFEVDRRPFTLTTSLDRIEIGHDGAITIADYKTGYIPPPIDIKRGLANQLFLEALILLHGRLDATPLRKEGLSIAGLEYWKLVGNPENCEIMAVEMQGLDAARERLETLVRQFDNPAMPYAAQSNPSLLAHYNDYEQLTRKQEWEEA